MNNYFTGSVLQTIERARVLKFNIATQHPIHFHALVQICRQKLDECIAELRSLKDVTSWQRDENEQVWFRSFRRIVDDLDHLESSGIAAIHRRHDDDIIMSRIVDRIVGEITYPLPPPTVSCLSQVYFAIDVGLNLLCVPLVESRFLLHLPDIFHELGHPLLTEVDNPAVELFQQARNAAIGEALTYLDDELQKARRRSKQPLSVIDRLGIWQYSWIKWWANEFFCDLFAVFTLGPAFAWSHLHLCAKRGDDPYNIPLRASTTHPADAARMEALLHGLSLIGFDKEAGRIEERWNEFVSFTSVERQPEYRHCFPKHLIQTIVNLALNGTQQLGCRIATSNSGAEVRDMLNDAWKQFWRDPSNYVKWEQMAVDELRREVSSDVASDMGHTLRRA